MKALYFEELFKFMDGEFAYQFYNRRWVDNICKIPGSHSPAVCADGLIWLTETMYESETGIMA